MTKRGTEQQEPVQINQSAGAFTKRVEQHAHVHYHNHGVIRHNNLLEVPDLNLIFDPFEVKEAIDICYQVVEPNKEYPARDGEKKVIDLADKHKLNNFTSDFWEYAITPRFEVLFNRFKSFIQLRANVDIAKKLEEIGQHIHIEIESKRSKNGTTAYEEYLQGIANTILDHRYEELSGKRDTVLLVLYFLYQQCSIGRKTKKEIEDANSE